MILFPIMGNKNITEEGYIDAIQKFERKCEKSLIETLSKVNINAIVKTDPYSLPFTDEVTVVLGGESYLNGSYEFFRVARKFVKELLDKDLYKIRFYIFVNIETNGIFGKVEYKLRYYK